MTLEAFACLVILTWWQISPLLNRGGVAVCKWKWNCFLKSFNECQNQLKYSFSKTQKKKQKYVDMKHSQ